MKEQRIRQVPLFSDLPSSEIQYLVQTLHPVEIPTGALLFREGEPGEIFYVLVEGEAEIIKGLGSSDERLLGVRSAGSMIGEMSLFSPGRARTASVRARTSLQLLEMTRDEFDILLHRQPDLAYQLVRTLSGRLVDSENTTIQDLRLKNQELTQAYQELKAAQEQLVEKERMEKELQVARGIQFSMMPRQLPQHPGFHFEAQIQPTRAVGGDFYDFIPLDQDHLGIAIGDVTDHGVPAALFMAMTVTLLRSEAHHSSSPAEVLLRVNRQLLLNNDLNMFVSVLYGILDYRNGDFLYARAGHEQPILLDKGGIVQQLEFFHGTMLGVLENIQLDERSFTFQPNQMLFLYTDGVTDELNEQGQPFGLQGLMVVLKELYLSEVDELCPALLEHIQAFRGISQPFDDITMLAIQAKDRIGKT